MNKKEVKLYDSTLRDGAQTKGINFSLDDKLKIFNILNDLGLDYIEGGWPGANPTDDSFFKKITKNSPSTLVAFGMMRKAGKSANNDPGLNAVLNSGVSSVCLVGKTWDFHVKNALKVSYSENLDMISDTIYHSAKRLDEVIFDAEHFFDGFKNNQKYSLEAISRAFEAGADWIVLCDTNGGTLPFELNKIINEVTKIIPADNLEFTFITIQITPLIILWPARLGVKQIQGTFNGLGERCGNSNLVNVASNLVLKMGINCKIKKNIKKITSASRMIDETLNRQSLRNSPFCWNGSICS